MTAQGTSFSGPENMTHHRANISLGCGLFHREKRQVTASLEYHFSSEKMTHDRLMQALGISFSSEKMICHRSQKHSIRSNTVHYTGIRHMSLNVRTTVCTSVPRSSYWKSGQQNAYEESRKSDDKNILQNCPLWQNVCNFNTWANEAPQSEALTSVGVILFPLWTGITYSPSPRS